MRIAYKRYAMMLALGVAPVVLEAQPSLPVISVMLNARADTVVYRGVRALRLVRTPDMDGKDDSMMAILGGDGFRNGTIEIDVAGAPRADAPPTSRGFIGISFRTGPKGEWSEVIYLRPTNGRADDQLRRNHSVQYASDPEFPWHRLRAEAPGVYESYADMEAGAWTKMRIVVAGTNAKLYVNGATQPCLIINDLKRGDIAGRIALWAHVATEAYFGAIVVTPS
jgi:hypothetical protein